MENHHHTVPRKKLPDRSGKNAEELKRLLAVVIEEHADVPATRWELTGPGQIFLRALPFAQPKTYADQARAMMFELSNIILGKLAREIEGVDADGKEFRLSDYRGNVVLLTFSANWCDHRVKLYPL